MSPFNPIFFCFSCLLLYFCTNEIFAYNTTIAQVPEPTVSAVLNGEAILTCNTSGENLNYCFIQKEGSTSLIMHIKSGNQTNGTEVMPGYFYIGAGLERGDCGIMIANVTEKDAGKWWCTISGSKTKGSTTLEVWNKPEAPTFNTDFGVVKEGDAATVTCLSSNNKTRPSFKWSIGNTSIDPSALSNIMNKTTENGRQVSFQTLQNYKFSWKDNGKELKCAVSHTLLKAKDVAEVTQLINVNYSPRSCDNQKTIRLIQSDIGRRAVVGINIMGNPKPRTTWRVGKITIQEGTNSTDARYEAKALVLADDEKNYRAELVIKKVEQSDLYVNFMLLAMNQIGAVELVVVTNGTSNDDASTDYTLAGIIAGLVAAVCITLGICIILKQRKQRRNQIPISNFSKGSLAKPTRQSPKEVNDEASKDERTNGTTMGPNEESSEATAEPSVEVAGVSVGESVVEIKI